MFLTKYAHHPYQKRYFASTLKTMSKIFIIYQKRTINNIDDVTLDYKIYDCTNKCTFDLRNTKNAL